MQLRGQQMKLKASTEATDVDLTPRPVYPNSYPEDRFKLDGKSVYLLMTDRFARKGGSSAGDSTACDTAWCNGTFAGIQEKLPYIKGMGFDCIWVTPVVENTAVEDTNGDCGSGWSYHGYWAQNIYKTDPHFGTNDELKELVKATHEHGMCFVLDIVLNHMGPIHPTPALSVERKIPFNKPEHYHKRGVPGYPANVSWDEYTAKYCWWPSPAQAMNPGTLCRLQFNKSTGEPDYTNNGNYCNNYKGGPPYNNETYLGADASGPPSLLYCGVGNFDCPGYNQSLIWEGWFDDLGDLNHSHPFVRERLLEWIEWLTKEFDIDSIRLDTAPFMPWEFLAEAQAAAHPVQIHGEVTSTNMSFHASFQKYPTADGGYQVLAGMENFPTMFKATPGYCGDAGQPSSPTSMWDLRQLGRVMENQLQPGRYVSVQNLMNFMDNQDYAPVASTCKNSETRIKNSLTWAMFCYGIPTITWGTEQGNTIYRNSLWQFGWNTTTWQYKFIAKLNKIRKGANVRLASTKVISYTADKLVFVRGGCRRGTWIYTNSLNTTGPVTYRGAPPRPPSGHVWFDAISCQRAKLSKGRFTAPSADPAVLVLRSTWKVTM